MTDVTTAINRINDRFNGDSLEALLDCFADDAWFEDAQGQRHEGKAAIGAAFGPIYNGSYGKVRFDWTDVLAIEAANQAVVTWTMTLGVGNPQPVVIKGIDLFTFRDGRAISKNTYGKSPPKAA